MASFLNVSRSQLAMSEKGDRSLPVSAIETLGRFLMVTLKAEELAKSALADEVQIKLETERTRLIQSELLRARHQLWEQNVLLEKLREQSEKVRKIKAVLPDLRATTIDWDNILINRIANNAEQMEMASAPAKQLKVELKIKALEAEVAYLEGL